MYAVLTKLKNSILSMFVIMLLAYNPTICIAAETKEPITVEDSSACDKSFHFGISIETGGPQYGRFGIFSEKKISQKITFITGLKYAYVIERASLPSKFYTDQNEDKEDLVLSNEIILSVPIDFKFYPWQCGFNFLVGFHLDFLLSSPMLYPFEKKISSLTVSDLEQNNIKGEFLKEISSLNRFKPTLHFAFAYDFEFGLAIGVSNYMPLKLYLNKIRYNSFDSHAEGYLTVILDFTKFFGI